VVITLGRSASASGPEDRPDRHRGRAKWIVLTSLGFAAAGSATVIGIVALTEDVRAVPVTFVNDTSVVVALPDCSTDIAQISIGESVHLPVAPDHPSECTIDDAMGGTVMGCITMPKVVLANTVIRLSTNHHCR
jgi:hypothetical protein